MINELNNSSSNKNITFSDLEKQYENYKNRVKSDLKLENNNNYFLSVPINEESNLVFECSLLKETSINLENEITDYVLESNSKVQDHISHNPLEINLNVLMSWNVEKTPSKISGQSFIESKLSQFTGFAPDLSIKAQEYYNKALDIKRKVELIAKKVDSGSMFFLNILENRNNNPYLASFNLLKNASDIGLELEVMTDFGNIPNMIIKSLNFRNTNEIDNASINITLKQLKKAAKEVRKVGRLRSQKSNVFNNGVVQGYRSIALTGAQDKLRILR